MPTGYTADVGDGKTTSFPDFALTCARGFGALVLLRDSDQSLEATRRFIAEGDYTGESSYDRQELERANERLAELLRMTDDEALRAARAAAEEVEAANARREAERREIRERYEAMLAQVEAWEPPTPDHESFKTFMVDQLRSSIDFDCKPFSMPVPEVSLAWRDQEVARQVERIERAKKSIDEERERNEGRRGWVEALLASLEGVPA